MKYRLKKDLPTLSAGAICHLNDCGDLVLYLPPRTDLPTEWGLTVYPALTLEKFPNILKDWFEEIPEEPKVELSGQYVPKKSGDIYSIAIRKKLIDPQKISSVFAYSCAEIGLSFQNESEAREAIDKMKAYQVLRRDAKGFEPDWKSSGQERWAGWYDQNIQEFYSTACYYGQRIGDIYFARKEDVEESFRTHRQEWLTVLGVEE